jgi:hypothetical protein
LERERERGERGLGSAGIEDFVCDFLFLFGVWIIIIVILLCC